MDQDELMPELKKFLNKVKLKEPSREVMANYLSEVNTKIDGGIKNFHFGFSQLATVFVIGVALAGLFYFLFTRPQAKPILEVKPVVQEVQRLPAAVSQVQQVQATPTQKALTVEEEMTVLEAFSDELSDDSVDLFGDDEALEELTVLDDVELSPQPPTQTAGF